MASKESDNASDEIIDKNCCICAGKSVTRSAEKFCEECQDYYCIPCTDLHKTFGYCLLTKADLSTHRLNTSLPCIPTERCQIHKAKVLDLFCSDHDEVVCVTCVAINHRACRDIHSIPDEIDNLYHRSAFFQSRKKLIEEKNASEIIKKKKQQLVQVLRKKRETAIKSIKRFREQLEAQLKTLEVESIKQVEEKYNCMEKDLRIEIKKAQKHIDELEQSTDKLQKSHGNKAKEFVGVKTAQKIINTASHYRRLQKKNVHVEILFSSNMELEKYLQQLEELGQVFTQDELFKSRTTAYKVKEQKNIVVKIKHKHYTRGRYGSCFTENGYCLLADTDNIKLTCIDMTTETIIDHVDLQAAPFAVCLTGTQEAAVSMNKGTIQFVSLGNKMTTTRKLKMDHYCYGLAYDDGKLYISDSGSSVYIHDLNGRKIRTINADKSGNPVFSDSRHISLSTDRECVYCTDYHTGVITLDLLGNYMSTFTDSNLIDPVGVCTDGRGNMFVCGYTSSNVIQISEKSKRKLCTIKTHSRPTSVSFDPYKNKLVTTHFEKDSVEVFEMC